MARRKKNQEEHVNHERWLVSYADFITLLFAFFVVMYSISAINEGKYRVLSDSISAAFDPTRDGLPIQLSSPLRPPILERDMRSHSPPLSVRNRYPEPPSGPRATAEDRRNLQAISQQIARDLQPLINQDLINVKNNDLWVEVEIKSSILFPSGSARLSPQAREVLRKIAAILARFPNQIQVEGFTDNVPIRTEAFPSNWELSAARAASVVHLFTQAGLAPKRLSAIGYGQYKPIASNASAAGRSKNRRINIIVQSAAIARRANRTEQLEQSLSDERRARQAAAEEKKRAVANSGNVIAPPIRILPPARTQPLGGAQP